MKCVLVLQLPTPDLRHGHVITASANPELVRHFCSTVIADQEQRAAGAQDLLEREFQRIRLEQLKVQLAWATGNGSIAQIPGDPGPAPQDLPKAHSSDV
jgi:hypothetical protein